VQHVPEVDQIREPVSAKQPHGDEVEEIERERQPE
jgi:hypothetical protein